MIWAVAAMVACFFFAFGLIVGTYYGVQREYERHQEAMYQLERLKRSGLVD